MQVCQEAGEVVWNYCLFKNFPVCCYTHKVFSVVNETEVDAFLEFLCFLHDPMDVGNLISGSSASLKPGLEVWKLLVHILLKPSLKDLGYDLAGLENSMDSV